MLEVLYFSNGICCIPRSKAVTSITVILVGWGEAYRLLEITKSEVKTILYIPEVTKSEVMFIECIPELTIYTGSNKSEVNPIQHIPKVTNFPFLF